MGGSESKTAISSLTEAITEISMNVVQTCEVVVQQEQDITINNTGFSWGSTKTIEQATDITQKCFSDVARQTELQNKIIDTISQASTSSSIAVLGAFGTSQASASANLTNLVRNNITMSNIQKNYTEIKQLQRVTYNNSMISIGDTLNIKQGAQAFAAATLKVVDNAGIFNQIEEHIDQTAAAKQENPLDFIAKAIGAVGEVISSTTFFFIFIVAAAVLGMVLILRAMGSSGDSSADAPPGEQPPAGSAPPESMPPMTSPGASAQSPPMPPTTLPSMPMQRPLAPPPQYAPPQYAPPRYAPRNTTSMFTKLSSAATGAQLGAKIPGPPQVKAAAAVTGAVAGLRA